MTTPTEYAANVDAALPDINNEAAISRAHFLRWAAGGIAGLLLPEIVTAPAFARHSRARAHETLPPMEKGINIPPLLWAANAHGPSAEQLRPVDIAVIWAPDWQRYEPEPGHYEEAAWQIYGADVPEALNAKKTWIAVPSHVPRWVAPDGYAPKHTGPRSAWAHFFRRVLDHYHAADGIIVENEPNLAYGKDQHMARRSVEMMMTAEMLKRETGYRGKLLGPAFADIFPDYAVKHMAQFMEWSHRLGWKPHHETSVAYHAYQGVKDNNLHGVLGVLALIEKHWPGTDRKLNLTELGYQYDTYKINSPHQLYGYKDLRGEEARQNRNLIAHYHACHRLGGRVATHVQYMLGDLPDNHFRSGLLRPDGVPHPVFHRWNRL